MKVETTWHGTTAVARLMGSIDTVDTEGASEVLNEIVSAKPGSLVLDFAGVEYIASMGLSMLLKVAQNMRKAKSPLFIAAATPAVKNILDTVHLGAAIPMVATVEAALERLGAKAAAHI